MVSTREKKGKVNYAELDAGSDNEDDKPKPKRQARVKRPKASALEDGFYGGKEASKNQPKQRRGKLRNIMAMPIDIFAEICHYLDPRDLRHLSLASHGLRNILVTKDARHIWRTVLSSVPGLPPCPEDMNELQYSRLMYSSDCYGCERRGTNTDWFHRVRYCGPCFNENMLSDRTIGPLAQHLPARLLIYASSMHVTVRARGYFRSTRPTSQFYLRSAIIAMDEQRAALLNVPNQSELLEGLSAEWETRSKMLKMTGMSMMDWKEKQQDARQSELDAMKNERYQSIKDKLFVLGWQEGDLPRYNKAFLSLVRKSQRLTPQVWQNLLPKLEPYLHEGRKERLLNEKEMRALTRRESFVRFYRQLVLEITGKSIDSPDRMCPEIYDFLALPGVKEVMEGDEEDVTDAMWADLVDNVRLVVLTHQQDLLQRFVDILDPPLAPAPLPLINTTVGPSDLPSLALENERMLHKLGLAVSGFWCQPCKQLFWFPNVIQHMRYQHNIKDTKNYTPHSELQRTLLIAILLSLDKDPETCTFEEMAALKDSLLCTRCDEQVAPAHCGLSAIMWHFIRENEWFTGATAFIAKHPAKAYPHGHNAGPNVGTVEPTPLPLLLDDHSWTTSDAQLVRSDALEEREVVRTLRQAFESQCRTDPDDDPAGVGGKEFEENYWRSRIKRTCTLCPVSYQPKGTTAARLKIHIQSKHGKAPDLTTDAKRISLYDPEFASNQEPHL